ncbi:hypothetical protein [Actinoplanes sp. NBRC 103695]|uniref:hypothetical protein n=1 Tax=Actinoplanes sp. NBRC 103695 TaxID=3032202 RepID=UPI0024A31CFD|nr:hypothetical protein [Actinoplanes sp. NBRC 103695]GLZ00663.1 hypothetical protein Acsp02_79150 [Actinoplanes sp. NBRC 103695]
MRTRYAEHLGTLRKVGDMESNALLAALLEESGMSRAGLAARINQAQPRGQKLTRYDHTSVGRWVNGQRPRGRTPEIICEILSEQLGRRIDLHDVGMGRSAGDQAVQLTDFVTRAGSLWRQDQRSGSSDSPVISGNRAIVPVWEWENPPEDRDVSRRAGPRVQPGDIIVLQAARTRYETMYRQVGGVATRSRVVNFLNEHTTPLLSGSYGDGTGRDLFRSTGGLAALAGICAYDSDVQGVAQRYFHQALRLVPRL